jgi:hypothetical protein
VPCVWHSKKNDPEHTRNDLCPQGNPGRTVGARPRSVVGMALCALAQEDDCTVNLTKAKENELTRMDVCQVSACTVPGDGVSSDSPR